MEKVTVIQLALALTLEHPNLTNEVRKEIVSLLAELLLAAAEAVVNQEVCDEAH